MLTGVLGGCTSKDSIRDFFPFHCLVRSNVLELVQDLWHSNHLMFSCLRRVGQFAIGQKRSSPIFILYS